MSISELTTKPSGAESLQRFEVFTDRSTLADWVGHAAWHLRPVHERLLAHPCAYAALT